MRLFIIRHGETEHNKNRIFQGQFNSFLSDTGFEQARLLAKRFKDYKLVNVYSSDLSRAKDTALEVLKFHKNSNLVLDKRIRERSFGELENNPIPADFNWANPPGFVEKREDFHSRIISFLEELKSKHKGEDVFIFTHGGVKRNMSYILNEGSLLNDNLRFFNTSVTIVDVLDDKNDFVLVNCTKHLE